MAYDLVAKLSLKDSNFTSGMRKATQAAERFDRIGQNMRGTLGSITFGQISLAAAVAGTGLAFKHAAETAINFEQKMSRVKAVAEATPAEFKKLEDAAMKLGGTTIFSASQVAEGMQVLAASGFKASQILDAIPGVLNAAAASGEDFTNVTDILTSAMHGFGLKATDMPRIADVLAKAANESAISIGDMGYTLKYVAPIAATAGQTLESVAAAAALLGNSGIKAETAGTSLRMGLLRLAAQPKDAAKALKSLSVAVTQNGKFKAFSNIIDDLNKSFTSLTQTEKLQRAKEIFGVEAAPAWVTLIEKGGAAFSEMEKKMVDAEGSAKKMADVMTDNVAGSIEELKGAWETLEISAMRPFLPLMKQVTDSLTNFVGEVTPNMEAASSNAASGMEKFFSTLKADEKFQALGWDDKLIFVMDKAIAGLDSYMAGEGGKKFDEIAAKLTVIGVKLGTAIGSAMVQGLMQAAQESWVLGAILSGAAGLMTPGPLPVKITAAAVTAGATLGGGAVNRALEASDEKQAAREAARTSLFEKLENTPKNQPVFQSSGMYSPSDLKIQSRRESNGQVSKTSPTTQNNSFNINLNYQGTGNTERDADNLLNHMAKRIKEAGGLGAGGGR